MSLLSINASKKTRLAYPVTAEDPEKRTKPNIVPDDGWRVEIENRYGASLVVADGPESVAIQRLEYLISDAKEAIYLIKNYDYTYK